MERWSTTGVFGLVPGQSVDPATDHVVVAISENDGGNARTELHRVTLDATDCPPKSSCFAANRAGTSWVHRDARKLADLAGACGFDLGGFRTARGNMVKVSLKGKSDAADACAYDFPRPGGTILREDIVIGDECATVLLDCTPSSGGKTYRCAPRP